MNVIMIMEDNLRKDHLGCYGNPWIKTPHIDRFASDTTIFDGGYGEGVPTLPVRAALQMGRYAPPFRGWSPQERKDLLLTEVLWDKGICTAMITDTYQFLKPHMGYLRGFECVEVIHGQEIDPSVLDPSIKVDLFQYSPKNGETGYSGRHVDETAKGIFIAPDAKSAF
jgi:arylsulfatase A-like enzyme